jgi:hypothetical protein
LIRNPTVLLKRLKEIFMQQPTEESFKEQCIAALLIVENLRLLTFLTLSG